MSIFEKFMITTGSLSVGVLIGAGLCQMGAATVAFEHQSAPYGGCVEAWQAPHSEGADWCRDQGWTIRVNPRNGEGIITNPHGVVRYNALLTCVVPDGSRGHLPCSRNINPNEGPGLAYYVTRNHRTHYVWAPSPLKGHPQREWVRSGLADALAEGGSDDATTRNWEQCWVNYGQTTRIGCPDGHKESS